MRAAELLSQRVAMPSRDGGRPHDAAALRNSGHGYPDCFDFKISSHGSTSQARNFSGDQCSHYFARSFSQCDSLAIARDRFIGGK